MSTSSAVGRIAAILALIGAFIVIMLLVLGGGSTYTVTAEFQNASQLVNGNLVEVAGVPAGTVNEIKLGNNGHALVTFTVESPYAPLAEGTTATIRSQSISGVANRYVALDMPPADKAGGPIKNGGVITPANTVSEVDLDQLFNSLNQKTVGGLQNVIKGFAVSYDGVGKQANKGFHYFNPFLSTSRRVFGELNSNQTALQSLLVDTASLTSALAQRSPDITRLVKGGAGTLGAIGRQNQNLALAVGRLPGFMRQFNTTAFNLRAALNDVTPLVNASKPVAKKLIPFSRNLRGFARDAIPAIKDLNSIVTAPGPANDLTDLLNLQVPLGQIAVGPVQRNGATREGALPASARALSGGLPQLSFLRPYITLEGVSGWFDDFGHSGVYDANGGIGRISTTFNVFSPSLPGIPNFAAPLSPSQIFGLGGGTPLLSFNNLRRCPGSNERGQTAAQLNYGGTIDCNTSQVPVGP